MAAIIYLFTVLFLVLKPLNVRFGLVWFAEGTAAYRQHDILVSGIMNIIIIIIIITVFIIIIIIITACCANRRQNRNYRLHPQLVQCSR